MRRYFPGVVRALFISMLAAVVGCGGESGTIISGKLETLSLSGASEAPPVGTALSNRGDAAPTAVAAAAVAELHSAEARLQASRDVMLATLDDAEFVPGEVIVAFREDGLFGPLQAQAEMQVAGSLLQAVEPMAVANAHVYRAADSDRKRTIEMIRELNQREDVRYAQPNYIYRALRTPNDLDAKGQWHYPAINLPAAWDLTIGSSDTVVAVVDTGILFDSRNAGANHPELVGKVLPGFDFIDDLNVGGDGDERDDNPFDVGDNPGGQSSYHGSHVAGTIAAATNNGVGVAGVNWSANILPVRALGVGGGGSSRDILQGVLWAAGFSIAGVPDNRNQADVINLSLGGNSFCPPLDQEVYDDVTARGTIVVVAAGNENQNAANVTPASCANVITVGATDFSGRRAPYSNFGTVVDVMAPGGDLGRDDNGDGDGDGVVSLGFNDLTRQFSVQSLQGTSMAAPHVAGVVSLMRALRPDLNTQDAVAILRGTANQVSAVDCGRASSSECGAGLIDAEAALINVDGGLPPPSNGPLAFNPNPVDFGSSASELSVTMTNVSTQPLSWSINSFETSSSNPVALAQGTFYFAAGATTSGSLDVGQSAQFTLGVARDSVSVPGNYAAELIFELGGEEQRLLTRFSTFPEDIEGPSGPTVVGAFIADATGNPQLIASKEETQFFSSYKLYTEPGENVLIAWSDDNGNFEIDEGDHLGVEPSVLIAEDQQIGGVNIEMSQVLNTAALPAPLSPGVLRALEAMAPRP